MNTFPRPKLVISKCINFEACRHNGSIISEPFLEKLAAYVDYVTVCPEVEIGLWTPRKAIRISRNADWEKALYQPDSGLDLTEKMNSFSDKFAKSLTTAELDGFILKNRSPSCGTNNVKVYNGFDTNMSQGKTGWFFAESMKENFPTAIIEDEGRLKNFKLREEFLMKIFCLARFREIERNIKSLWEFHQNYKFMYMAFTPQHELWKIVASYKKGNIEELFPLYKSELERVLKKWTSKWRMINSFEHIFGGFKNIVSPTEKNYYLDQIVLYRENKIPTSSIISLFQILAIHHKNEYVVNQALLHPYPSDLLYLHDSGKDLIL